MSEKLERLIPRHIGGESNHGKEDSAVERYEQRQETLDKAPRLESQLRKLLKERGTEPPEGLNLSLVAIEEFQQIANEAQDFRAVVKKAKDPKERAEALKLFHLKEQKLKEYLAYGPSFESAYREYIRSKNEYIHFKGTLLDIARLKDELQSATFESVPADAKRGHKRQFDEAAHARMEAVARETGGKSLEVEQDELLASLSYVYPVGSPEYKALKKQLAESSAGIDVSRTKKDIQGELEALEVQAHEQWDNPMVRYFWAQADLEKMLADFAAGKDVVETPTTIKHLNELDTWERQHQRTTIGGVLVGEPGTGKTTIARHYLEQKGRNYVYIDLSEDVTRYMLYGSKSLEFKSPTEYYENLLKKLAALSEDDFKKLVLENGKQLKATFGVKGDEATVTFLGQLEEELERGKAVDPALEGKITEVQRKVNNLAQASFRKQLADEFGHMVKKNGWRDGVVIAALRRGDSVILDEFNKNKNWSLIYGLMTAKPGEDWYFADNDEKIQIPDNWRLYFTANIGKKHGGFEVAEALASRAGGKVMEVDPPSKDEEMLVALAALADADGNFLRSKADLVKLYVVVNELLPKVRAYIADKKQAIPVSYRTIRDLGEKLVQRLDPKTKKPIYHPSDMSMDQALYEVMIHSYALYEDDTIPVNIVNLATTQGLLLDDPKIKDDVIACIGKEEYEKRQGLFKDRQEDFDDIAKKIRGLKELSQDALSSALPEQRHF